MRTSRKSVGHKWLDVKCDRLLPELALFFSRPSHRRWAERCDQWETHVNVFASISNNKLTKEDWRDTRVTFLLQHLGILDTKFGVLLTVSTLLLVALNVLLGVVFNLNKDVVDRAVQVPAIGFGTVWLFSTVLCLIAERRLVWGDLGLIDGTRLVWDDFKSSEQLAKAEAAHVDSLIVEIVKRTNKFRVAILFTHLQVVLFVLTFVAALLGLAGARPLFR